MPSTDPTVTVHMSPLLRPLVSYTDDLYGITRQMQVPCVRVALTYMETSGMGFQLLMLTWWRPLN